MKFMFNDKWRYWIRACVFATNLEVLVNSFQTQEINIQRGLKQGDFLAPFLFMIVAEGLSGLISTTIELYLPSRFRVGASDFLVSLFQYANDILFLADPSIENL